MRTAPLRVARSLLVCLLFAGCGSSAGDDPAGDSAGDDSTGDDSSGDDSAGDDSGDDSGEDCAAGDPFDPANLAADVSFLASDELAGRAPGTPGDESARAYIEERFRCLGLDAAGANGAFQQPFEAPDGARTANVVAYVPGVDPVLASELIVLGAHHDHLGVLGGEIHNGANDNASGTAALLAVARAVRERATPPRRTIVFAAFGYEENDGDCLGSEFYVRHAPEGLPMDRVVTMVNADMVGTYAVDGVVTAYGSMPGTAGRRLLDQLIPQQELDFELGVTAGDDDSDFQAFCDLGIPYLYFETWDEECYHAPCDDAGRLDYAGMSSLTAFIADVVVGLADSDEDLAAERGRGACRSG